MKRLVILLAVPAILAACGEDPDWRTRDVTGVLSSLEFELTDEHGDPVTQAAYAGSPVAVFFGFTHCPDICPITLGRLRSAISELPEPMRDELQVLFVSVDPGRDGPENLREYTGFFGPQFTGLTAEESVLRDLTRRFRATFSYGEPGPEGDYTVSHPSAVYVFGPDGRARLLIRQDDTVEAIAHDLQRLIAQS